VDIFRRLFLTSMFGLLRNGYPPRRARDVCRLPQIRHAGFRSRAHATAWTVPKGTEKKRSFSADGASRAFMRLYSAAPHPRCHPNSMNVRAKAANTPHATCAMSREGRISYLIRAMEFCERCSHESSLVRWRPLTALLKQRPAPFSRSCARCCSTCHAGVPR
jgi:hypothetical protein